MSSTPSRPVDSASPSPPYTGVVKRKFVTFADEDVPLLKLPCPADRSIANAKNPDVTEPVLKTDSGFGDDMEDTTPVLKTDSEFGDDIKDNIPKPSRVLPGFITQRTVSEAPDQSSQESETNGQGRLDLELLKEAKVYVDGRIDSRDNERDSRYAMCGVSPPGSQNSVEVRYSQNSTTDEEPIPLRKIADIVLNTLPEGRIQQLFPIGGESDPNPALERWRRVRTAIPYLSTNLDFLSALLEEAINVLHSKDDVPPPPLRTLTLGTDVEDKVASSTADDMASRADADGFSRVPS